MNKTYTQSGRKNSHNSAAKILILGAGIAGLAAAQQLVQDGFDVKVLEARARIGGRIVTDHSLGLPLDLGAAWLHGIENNPIAAIAKKLHLKIAETNFSRQLFFDRQQKMIPFSKLENYFAQLQTILQQAKTYALQLNTDISLAAAVEAVYFPEKFFEPDILNWCMKRLALYNAAEPELLSAQHWDEEETLAGGNHLMLEGYDKILSLFKNIPVQLNTVVSKIVTDKHSIKVIANRGEWTADAALITFPLGVLKKYPHLFEPELPLDKRSAIQRLGMGTFNRIFLKFPQRFWPLEPHGLYLPSSDKNDPEFFFNYAAFSEQPILFGVLGGSKAATLEQLTDADLIQRCLKSLKMYFGNDIPHPQKYLITRWKTDAFSLGSYAYVPVNATFDDFDTLATPVGKRLFFAGEATSRNLPASVAGAYLSGLREAQRIKTML